MKQTVSLTPGSCGRMGSKIIKTVLQQDDMEVVAAIEAPNSPFEGKDVGETIGIGEIGVKVTGAENLKKELTEKKPDVLVDFTIAKAAMVTIKTWRTQHQVQLAGHRMFLFK